AKQKERKKATKSSFDIQKLNQDLKKNGGDR
ncbi:MAG: hypothetical protein JWM28_4228, partial [Chitinophagaceae bacterium]|nr:hypothetical protein [Chitinophagaceae bacterium]